MPHSSTESEPPTCLETYISHDPKDISIATYTPSSTVTNPTIPTLIFAHGAGGSMHTGSVLNFREGFTTKATCLCFQGNMNLGSRVKMFKRVVQYEREKDSAKAPILGGRSMGARAAVIAATELHNGATDGDNKEVDGVIDSDVSESLILISYPLHDSKDRSREQILLDLPASFQVLFVIGSRDSMCDIDRLRDVRQKMQCKTWLVVVEGANHGMEMKPAKATEEVGMMSGKVAVEWLRSSEEEKREARIFWDVGYGEGEKGKAQFGGWEAISKGSTKREFSETSSSVENHEREGEKSAPNKKQNIKSKDTKMSDLTSAHNKKSKSADPTPKTSDASTLRGKSSKQKTQTNATRTSDHTSTTKDKAENADQTPKANGTSASNSTKRKRITVDRNVTEHISRRTRSSGRVRV